jgi:hypothetical protein
LFDAVVFRGRGKTEGRTDVLMVVLDNKERQRRMDTGQEVRNDRTDGRTDGWTEGRYDRKEESISRKKGKILRKEGQ